MKFLILTNHSYMLWQFRRELITALLEKGDVTISTPFNGRQDDFAGLGCEMIKTDVDRRGVNPLKDLSLFRAYLKIIKSEKPDKIITYSIKPNIYGGVASRIRKTEYLANVQGLGTAFQNKALAKIVTFLYKLGLKGAKTVFFENSDNANTFLKRKIIDPSKIKVLNGAGVNLDYYNFREYPRNDATDFLFVGRIMREKGVDELFYAAKKLKEEFKDKVNIDVVGFFEDEYKEKTENLQNEGVIRFHGFQSDPRPFYEKCSCVVSPSYHEGLSNVLLESASMGRPVIATDVPGCRETLDDGETGFLVNKKDGDMLYRKMRDFANLSFSRKALMGKKARLKAENEFSKEEIVNETLKEILK